MNFRVGQLVICINDSFPLDKFDSSDVLPIKDSIYRVRELPVIIGLPLIRLEEIRNPVREATYGTYEAAFHRSRFKPLVDRPASISVFTEILDRGNAKPRDKVTA